VYTDLSTSNLLFQAFIVTLVVITAIKLAVSRQANAALVKIRRHIRHPKER